MLVMNWVQKLFASYFYVSSFLEPYNSSEFHYLSQ